MMRIGKKTGIALGVLATLAVGAMATRTWLGRQTVAESARLARLLELQSGASVAEIGAGDGEMTVLLARHLGRSGTMYATEIETDKRDRIQQTVRQAGLDHVTVIEAKQRSTNLPAGCCDAALMRRVYHHITAPADFNTSLFESLKPGGRLAVVDFEPGGVMGFLPDVARAPANRGGHGIPFDVLIEELTAAGFELEKRIDDWYSVNFCVVVRKPPAGS